MENIQIKRLGIFHKITLFSLLGITVYEDEFHWTGIMFGYSNLIFEKIKTRYLYFNEYYYQMEYTDWRYSYELIKSS